MESFKDIPGFSNYSINTNATIMNKKFNKILVATKCKGYERIKIKNDAGIYKNVFVHRLVLITFVPNPLCKPHADHIDGNPLNNCLSNLRWATESENNMNCGLSVRNKSGHKGVYQSKSGKWVAFICQNNKNVYLGCFEDKHEAVRKANEERIRLYGEYVRLS